MKSNSVYQGLNKSKPGALALFDPDRIPLTKVGRLTEFVCENGVSGILVGTSLLVSPNFEKFIESVKKYSKKPVILFPGGCHQVSPHADAIFFLSMLSGRNANFLIGEQVKAVFLVKHYHLEVIPVGYLLVESGNYTSVEYVSNTRSIPRAKSEIALAHALAGQYLGMKFIYLEAGSGAKNPVPKNMVAQVSKNISIPLIVGGGIRTAKTALEIIKAGADYIVLGSIIERSKENFKKIMRSL